MVGGAVAVLVGPENRFMNAHLIYFFLALQIVLQILSIWYAYRIARVWATPTFAWLLLAASFISLLVVRVDSLWLYPAVFATYNPIVYFNNIIANTAQSLLELAAILSLHVLIRKRFEE